uniref:MARVEL domain-containing protein n=1 Tax=Globodera rostochiensis TaxID=31243 RepID=A0A914GWU3_GLORO
MAELITKLCTTKLAILKWLQMLCAVISVLFLIDGRRQWWPYTLIFVVAIVLGILSLITLIANFFLQSQNGLVPLPLLEIGFNAFATALCLGFAVCLSVDFAKMVGGDFSHHRYLPPANIGKDGWRNRILVVAIVQAVASICYGLSAHRVKRGRAN